MDDIKTAKPEKGVGGRVFQIIVSLILFAGFITFLFVPKAYGDSSLWSMVLDVFKGGYSETALLRYSLFGIVGFYAVLLVCTVVSLFTKAGSALACNFVKAFVALAAFAVFAYALNKDLGVAFSELLLDDTTFVAVNAITCSAALALVGTIVLNFVAYKGLGVVKFVFALFAAGFFVFAKDYTFLAETTFADLLGGLELGEGIVATITGYAFTVLGWAVIVNMALAVITMMLPRTSILDLVRAIVVFVLAALALIMGGVYDSFSTLFDHIGIVGVTGVALAQLIYAIIVVVILHARNKKKEAEEDAADDMFVVDANDQMAIKGWEAPAATAGAQEAPAAQAARPEPQFAQDATAANSAFEDASQISIEDITEEAAKEEAAEEELAADASQPEEKDFDYEQAKFDGKFNRAYAEFAEQEELKKQQEEQAKQQAAQQAAQQQQPYYGYGGYNYQQAQQTTPPPYYGGYAQQQPYQQGQGYYNAGFIPDMFISSLTPAERDEFDRLFISRIYGENKRLPAYQIGGDNREFFTKIFVFMGRYRNVISEGLLEKIYNYSNSIK